MRAVGTRPDGRPWTVAVEAPDAARRAPHSILALQDAAVATSGDYRHRVGVGGLVLSHTMDPRRGAPLPAPPASVTVVARSCAEADAWATALMVVGPDAGGRLAPQLGLDALFLLREDHATVRAVKIGRMFAGASAEHTMSAPGPRGEGPTQTRGQDMGAGSCGR
jgi:FAD:protein FMN transferase